MRLDYRMNYGIERLKVRKQQIKQVSWIMLFKNNWLNLKNLKINKVNKNKIILFIKQDDSFIWEYDNKISDYFL
jgi:hypothetical protein